MAKQVLNNGDTGLQIRTKLNENMAELYNGVGNPVAGNIQSETFVATAGQTVFPLTDTDGDIFLFYVDKVQQDLTDGYNLNAEKNQATTTSGVPAGTAVTAIYYKASAIVSNIIVKKAGTTIGTRAGINLIEGANVTITVTDDAGNGEVDITIASSGEGGGSGHTIQDEGIGLTARTNLNFVGAGVTVTDEEGSNTTKVTIAGGGIDTTTPVVTYTHSGNREVVVSAVDVGTDTFTSVAHGLVNGDKIGPTLNTNVVISTNAYPPTYYQTPITNFAGVYYVVNKTDNTFQLSLTAGGAAIDLTTNATLDLTKWHFEVFPGDVTITSIPDAKKYKVLICGRSLGDFATAIFQVNAVTGSAIKEASATLQVVNYPCMGSIFSRSTIEIDFSNELFLLYDTYLAKVNANAGQYNVAVDRRKLIVPSAKNENINTLIFKYTNATSQWGMANGTKVEIYKM